MLRLLSVFLLLTGTKGSTPTISVVGHPIKVWSSVETYEKCGAAHGIDVPDIPPRLYTTSPDDGTVFMIEGSTTTYHMNGTSIFNLTRECSLAWNMTANSNPQMFAANEFLDSTIAFPNGTVVSLIHTEFPGNRYNQCTGPAYPHCWTVTIGLAISHDWGKTWQHARPPPHHLVAAVPYGYNESQLAYGWGDPSNIVKYDGFYYVAMWNRHDVGLQKAGICMARTNNLMDPTSWRGWNGQSFSSTFVSPYDLKPQDSEEPHICSVVNLPPLCAALSMVWSTHLEEFVAILGCMNSDKGSLSRSFYMATSKDIINWSPSQPFYSMDDIPPDVKKMVTSIVYPNFVDPAAPLQYDDINYYTIGQQPYLFWVSIGHSVHSDGRHVWATPMKFIKEDLETANT